MPTESPGVLASRIFSRICTKSVSLLIQASAVAKLPLHEMVLDAFAIKCHCTRSTFLLSFSENLTHSVSSMEKLDLYFSFCGQALLVTA